jgi:hypothetical protein
LCGQMPLQLLGAEVIPIHSSTKLIWRSYFRKVTQYY